MRGPLTGLKVLEFVGIGPGPHCGMLLSDLGAEVLRIDRPGGNGWEGLIVDRGRGTVTLDIRSDEGRETALTLADHADVLIEGMRPGVMERLGLGPDAIAARNPRLIYGRMTGWGQTGPLAQVAAHDINYVALTGALAALRHPGEPPMPPLNLVGDFGGGSMFLAMGILAALWERERSGKGQVVDAAIVDGVAALLTMFASVGGNGRLAMDANANLLSGASSYYRCYETADDKFISIGPIEPHFYRLLLDLIEAPDDVKSASREREDWPDLSDKLAAIFIRKTRDEWTALLEGTDACYAPVLELAEVPDHPHSQARQIYVEKDGKMQAAPAPRFSRTPGVIAEDEDGWAMFERWKAINPG